MSTYFGTTVEEIELVCSYIKDDQTIANYFGISRQRVERVRANMQTARWMRKSEHEPRRASRGIMSHIEAADEAELGSRNLNAAYQRMFRKWEEENGFQYGAAEILLPAGYVPARQKEVA